MEILNFTGVEKTQEDDVPQSDLEKDAATGPMTGNVIVCFAIKPKPKFILAIEWGYCVLLKPQ